MALKSGRVGVKKTEVDYKGKIKGGSSDLGGLKFRVTPEGQAQYKTPNGEWVNFSSGASGISTLIEIPQGASKLYPDSTTDRVIKEDSTAENWSGYMDITPYRGKKCIVFGLSDSSNTSYKNLRMGFYDVEPNVKGVQGVKPTELPLYKILSASSTSSAIIEVPTDKTYFFVYSATTSEGESKNVKAYALFFE